MRVRRLAPLAALAACLACAAPASATSVYLTGNGQSKTLHIDGGPGELNQPYLQQVNDNGTWELRVLDYWSAPTSGSGCTQIDPTLVRCPMTPVVAVNVALGDNDDRFGTDLIALPMTVDGGDGNDFLSSGDGNDVISGGAGNDYVSGANGGADVFSGGDGVDTITFDRGGQQSISLNDLADDGLAGEHDNVHSDFESVTGGWDADTITGTSGNDTLSGAGGADIIHGGQGDDVIAGGTPAEYSHGCSADQVFGDDGNDLIDGTEAGTADGGPGDDTVRTDLACAGLAVSGGVGHDLLDARYGQSGLQISLDGAANDGPSAAGPTANVGAEFEDVAGSPYDDVITGDNAPNHIQGGLGDDLMDGGGGADELEGGDGSDIVDYSSRTAPVHADVGGAPGGDGEDGEGDTVGSDVEGFVGGSGDDVLTGGPGDDLLDGGPGADQLAGGAGEDAVDYSLRTNPVTADADGAIGDDGEAGEGDSIATDVEDIYGGDGADSLTGNAAANFLYGGPGADVLAGGEGDDALEGGPGNDTLDGGPGFDEFFGDQGDDTIAMRDDVAEQATCGDGGDSVTADIDDETDPDCETVDRPAVTVVTQPTPTGPTRTSPTRTPIVHPLPTPAPPDVTAPVATLTAVRVPLKVALKRGVAFSVSCDEDCSTELALTLSVKQLRRLGFRYAKRPMVVARGGHTFSDATAYHVVVHFRKSMRARLAKARSLTLDVRAVFSDLMDNERHRPRSTLKLSR